MPEKGVFSHCYDVIPIMLYSIHPLCDGIEQIWSKGGWLHTSEELHIFMLVSGIRKGITERDWHPVTFPLNHTLPIIITQ